MQPLQIIVFITLYMLPFKPLHYSCTHFWQLVYCSIHVPDSLFAQSHSKFSFFSLGLAPSTFYSIYFFTQSLSYFRNTCPYHRNLFRCSTEIMSSNPSLSLNTLLGILSCSFMPHIYLTILISACWSATSFSFHEPLIPFASTVTLLDTPFRQFDHVISCLSFTIYFAIRKIFFDAQDHLGSPVPCFKMQV